LPKYVFKSAAQPAAAATAAATSQAAYCLVSGDFLLTQLQLVLGIAHGTFIFPHEPVYGWYLSVTAIGLNISWALHNVIAWLKNRRFLSPKISKIYIITVILCWPYWILEIYANFTYFNNINDIFLKTRPLEPLFR
jgi:hypothetical protein